MQFSVVVGAYASRVVDCIRPTIGKAQQVVHLYVEVPRRRLKRLIGATWHFALKLSSHSGDRRDQWTAVIGGSCCKPLSRLLLQRATVACQQLFDGLSSKPPCLILKIGFLLFNVDGVRGGWPKSGDWPAPGSVDSILS